MPAGDYTQAAREKFIAGAPVDLLFFPTVLYSPVMATHKFY